MSIYLCNVCKQWFNTTAELKHHTCGEKKVEKPVVKEEAPVVKEEVKVVIDEPIAPTPEPEVSEESEQPKRGRKKAEQ